MTKARDLSQSAIVESGSNANGEYTKWDDGTMMCWQTGLISSADADTAWVFPEPFISGGYGLSITHNGGSTSAIIPSTTGYGLTQASFSMYTLAGTRTVAVVSLMVIGRWK